MPNPIMQMLNQPNNNLISQIMSIKDPQATFNNMMQNNPQFRSFVESNKGKSADQIARDYGLDPSILRLFR